MRLISFLCMVLLVSLANAGDPAHTPKGVTTHFIGVDYHLAWVDAGEGNRAITNEYLAEGATLEDWETMVAVRKWPNLTEVKQVSGPYLSQINASFVRKAEVYSPPPGTVGTDFVLKCYLAPPDKSYLEYNLIRFGIEPGEKGVKSYQFAVRGPYSLENAIEFNSARLGERLDALTKLRLSVRTNIPSHSNAQPASTELASPTESVSE